MTIALLLLTLAITAVTVISIWQSNRIKRFDTEITIFEENRYLMQQLSLAVMDNETGARGFVITGKRNFLDPMISSERKLDELRITLAKNTVTPLVAKLLNDSLSPLIDLRKEFSWQMVALVNNGKNEEARQLVLSGVGKKYTDEARRIIAKMDTVRNTILENKRKENEAFIHDLNNLLILILVIILITSAFNFRQLALSYKKQKQTEQQLRQNEQLYSALFYKSPIAKWIVSPQDNVMIDVNDSFCNLFYVKREDVVGKTTKETGLNNSPDVAERVGQQLKEKGFVRNLEYKATLPGGEIKWVSMSIDPIKLDGKDCFVGASVDITAIKQSEELYSTLFYKSPSMNWIWSPDTTAMLEVNDNFCRYLKLEKDEIIGKTSEELGLTTSQEDTDRILALVSKQGYADNLEYKLKLKDKELTWVSANISMVYYKEHMCMMGALTDITAIKQNEELTANMNIELERKVLEKTAELRENEQKLQALNETLELIVEKRTEQLTKANKEMEAFSYSVSHDLRAPLRGIIGFTNIIQEDFGDVMQEEEKRLFAVIKKNTEKMGNLIDDLLDFSRLGRKEITKAPINTAQMIQEVIEDISRHHPAADAIEWVVGTLPSVQADVSTIRQVWTNLLSNAVKYSKVNAKPRIEIGSYKENNQTVFYVKDNGVGFDEKYKEKLFRVFQRLHSENEFEGTGIGLALVEKIISRHDGKVWANGEVNKGASFYFSLP